MAAGIFPAPCSTSPAAGAQRGGTVEIGGIPIFLESEDAVSGEVRGEAVVDSLSRSEDLREASSPCTRHGRNPDWDRGHE